MAICVMKKVYSGGLLLSTFTMFVIHLFLSIVTEVLTSANLGTSLLDRHLKVAAVPWRPFIMFYCNEKEMGDAHDCTNNGNITYGGALWDFLNMVKLKRNVTFSVLSPPTPTWGYCHGINNCTGMIGMVNRKEVDFALGIFLNHLTMTETFLEN